VTDIRLQQLTEWLTFALEDDEINVTVASADASFRRYFRVESKGKNWIAMDAPPAHEDCKLFVKVATAFHHVGMNVPEIYAQDLSRGFLVLTDFGNTCYLEELSNETADKFYDDAMQALLKLQVNSKMKGIVLPDYNSELLMREMRLFDKWFLSEHLNHKPNNDELRLLLSTYEQLKDMALSQHQVWVHRDYHSRNLMVVAENNPGVIDFQDAVVGAVTYDLVSLLRDCYISWPIEKIEQWVNQYHAMLQAENVCNDISGELFLRWFDWMGIQRHLKAIGIFARLNYRDGKPGYLSDIPRTLNYVETVSAKYPELSEFHQIISDIVLPKLNAKAVAL